MRKRPSAVLLRRRAGKPGYSPPPAAARYRPRSEARPRSAAGRSGCSPCSPTGARSSGGRSARFPAPYCSAAGRCRTHPAAARSRCPAAMRKRPSAALLRRRAGKPGYSPTPAAARYRLRSEARPRPAAAGRPGCSVRFPAEVQSSGRQPGRSAPEARRRSPGPGNSQSSAAPARSRRFGTAAALPGDTAAGVHTGAGNRSRRSGSAAGDGSPAARRTPARAEKLCRPGCRTWASPAAGEADRPDCIRFWEPCIPAGRSGSLRPGIRSPEGDRTPGRRRRDPGVSPDLCPPARFLFRAHPLLSAGSHGCRADVRACQGRSHGCLWDPPH